MNYVLFQLSDKLFLRDPQKTETGQLLLRKSIELMDKTGFEQFTFRKLADTIKSTEATIYRYFENKQRLLHYLVNWYWTLTNFRIDYSLNNISDPEEKLKVCLQVLSGTRSAAEITGINEAALHRIVMAELDKTYLTKNIEKDIKLGLLDAFNETCNKISAIVLEINPGYQFPHSLVSTAIHAATQQVFFAHYLPGLSDLKKDQKEINEQLYSFLEGFVLNTVKSAR